MRGSGEREGQPGYLFQLETLPLKKLAFTSLTDCEIYSDFESRG